MGYIDHVLQDAPVAYWPCQETAGLQIKDVVGTKHITFNSGAMNAAGPGIQGADKAFQGTTNTFGAVSFSQAIPVFSVEWWNYPLDAVNYYCPVYASNITDFNATINAWGSFVWHGHTASANCFFCGTDVGTRFTNTQTAGQYLTTTWVYWTFTYDGTSGRMYKNGSLLLGPQTMTNPITFTGMAVGGSNPSNYAFNGRISHLALHNQALSANRVAARYRERLRGGVAY